MKKELEKIFSLFKKYDSNYNFKEVIYRYNEDGIEIDGKQGSLPFYFYQAGISDENGKLKRKFIEEKIKQLTENLNKIVPLNYSDIEYDGIKIISGEEYDGWRLKTIDEMKELYDDEIEGLNNRHDNLLFLENEEGEYYFLGEEEFFNILEEIKNELKLEIDKEENNSLSM